MQIATKTQLKFIETCSPLYNNRFEYRGDFLSKSTVTLYDTVHSIIITQDKSSHYKGRLPKELKTLDHKDNTLKYLKDLSKSFNRPVKILDYTEISNKKYVKYLDMKLVDVGEIAIKIIY